MMSDPVAELKERFDRMRANGLKDFKIWMPETPSPGTTIEDLCREVLSIMDVYESGNYEDITAKLD
jgi:hypothetical protein